MSGEPVWGGTILDTILRIRMEVHSASHWSLAIFLDPVDFGRVLRVPTLTSARWDLDHLKLAGVAIKEDRKLPPRVIRIEYIDRFGVARRIVRGAFS